MLDFLELLASFVAVVVVISFHEFAHAYAAYKCGDPTAKFSGRMTLNPVKHFDLLGMLMFAVVGFGWAKPVPINPCNFKKYYKGLLWTSIAGVLINYVMAFLFYPLLLAIVFYVCPLFEGLMAEYFIYRLFYFFYAYSLGFCVFNLLPLYPLDGFRIWESLDSKKGKIYQFIRQYGYYILLGLMLVSMLANRIPILGYIDILGYFRLFATNILGKPITLLWNWIFSFIIH